MWHVIASEWLKFRSLRSNLYLLASSLISILLCVGVAYLVSRGFDGQSAEDRLRFTSLGAGLGTGLPVAYFIVGALGALSITHEHASGQIRTSLTVVSKRQLLLFAKVPALALITLVAGQILVFGMHFATQAVLGDRAEQVVGGGRALGPSLGDPGVAAELLTAGAIMPLIAMVGLGVGALIRSTAGSLVTLVMILLVLPIVSGALPTPWRSRISSVMIESLPTQIASGEGTGVFALLLSPLAAAAALIAYPVVALTAGAVATAVRGRRIRPLVVGGLITALLATVIAISPGAGAGSLAWQPHHSSVEVPVAT
ncbi:hypothetical protein [Rhizohabitans arisaemae]|uniref:hypothetical protein n=1 Tax=Rhizohabitans arisaemae TaxID=2720610 RepID=UPI0024B194C9|nr:hypothetical protein [Rhizohabitans arisaemae]